MTKQRSLYLWLGGVAFGVFIFAWIVQYANFASGRIFWNDEGIELFHSCNEAFTTLLFKGASLQASPAPLHYLIQKIAYPMAVKIGVEPFLAGRLISLISTVLSAFILFLYFWRKGYWAGALLAVAGIITVPIFADFITQTRPYMLWNLLFLATVIFAAIRLDSTSKSLWRIGPFAQWIFLSVLLSTVSLVGSIQAVGVIVAAICYFVFWERKLPPKWLWCIVIIAILFALTFLYAQVRDADPDSDTYQFIRSGGVVQWDLLKGIPRLVFPKADWVLNLLVFAGLCYPLVSRRRSETLALWWIVFCQFAIFAVITALIILQNYFLIQRLFINLVICRGLMIGIGVITILTLAQRFLKSLPKQREFAFQAVISVYALVILGQNFLMIKKSGYIFQSAFDSFITAEKNKFDCKQVKHQTYYLQAPPEMKELWAVHPNSLVYFHEMLQSCPQENRSGEGYIYYDNAKNFGSDPIPDGFSLLDAPREGAMMIEICSSPASVPIKTLN